MQKYIPYGRQWIDDDDIQAVVDTLRSDFLTTGPKVEEFEQVLSQYTDTRYAVAIANGTAALHAAMVAAGIGQGDEVITTPMTFAASANCALYVGAKPVFADIDPQTYNLDPVEIEKKITRNTKAIIPVHFTGQPCDMDAILKIAKAHDLAVIEDGAHALGATYQGKKIGGIGDMTTMSFHPVKHITTGEGGAILTNDETLYQTLSLFRTHGITRHPKLLTKQEGPWFYEQQLLGYNYRMSDIQCALGISQMKKLPMFLEKRREIAKRYHEAFRSLKAVSKPYQLETTESAWHLYIIKLETEHLHCDRLHIVKELQALQLGINVHYIPVYYHPYYQNLGYTKGICPVAEDLYERMISIPLFPAMTDEEVDYVIQSVTRVIENFTM